MLLDARCSSLAPPWARHHKNQCLVATQTQRHSTALRPNSVTAPELAEGLGLSRRQPAKVGLVVRVHTWGHHNDCIGLGALRPQMHRRVVQTTPPLLPSRSAGARGPAKQPLQAVAAAVPGSLPAISSM